MLPVSKASDGGAQNVDESLDDRGIQFGTAVAYDDAYAGGVDDVYVSELQTRDEERQLVDEYVLTGDQGDELDEGRPSHAKVGMEANSLQQTCKNLLLESHVCLCDLFLRRKMMTTIPLQAVSLHLGWQIRVCQIARRNTTSVDTTASFEKTV